jgi:alpha-ketoglutaric semialdehyde dehydrogenase
MTTSGQILRAIDPSHGTELPGDFPIASATQTIQAVEQAAAAAAAYAELDGEQRGNFLQTVAAGIEDLGEAVIERAHLETSLSLARLRDERGRTLGQLRMFADLVRTGDWIDARIDPGDPLRTPRPRPDLRRMLIPIGPVAVFAASNFPLAFSVAGGDTAAALAAGCPVVVKAHPGHPGTSALVAGALQRAVERAGLPPGVFQLLHGHVETARSLVLAPELRAVAFTGSLRAGRALMDIAASRPDPIPVFAEMGSVNPVFVMPQTLAARGSAIGTAIAKAVVLGYGQFCTNPGLVAVCEGPGLQEFLAAMAAEVAATPPATLLTSAIRAAFVDAFSRQRSTPGVQQLARVQLTGSSRDGQESGGLLSTDAATLIANPHLADEVFGPSSLMVKCRDFPEMLQLARALTGQLTASLYAEPTEWPDAKPLITCLVQRAGRLIANNVPTGVEVAHAMQHGGPWPAASDSRSTSVGSAAILRFARPICYQDFPQECLPSALRG